MNAVIAYIRSEVVVLQALVQVTIALATSFGLNLTEQQEAAIMSFAAVALALLTRSQVTPTVKSAPINLSGQ